MRRDARKGRKAQCCFILDGWSVRSARLNRTMGVDDGVDNPVVGIFFPSASHRSRRRSLFIIISGKADEPYPLVGSSSNGINGEERLPSSASH